MKKYQLFIGIDVSKLKLDLSIYNGTKSGKTVHKLIENDKKSIRNIILWIKKEYKIDFSKILFCLEHTGIYALPICSYLNEKGLNYALELAAQIKKSLGIQRGKNDKVDAKTIARYAFLHQSEITTYQLPEKLIVKLKTLLSYRDRLVKAKKSFLIPAKELDLFVEKEVANVVVKDSKKMVKILIEKIKQIDIRVLELINSEEKVKTVYDLVTSVPGVGPQIAAQLIVYTRCFTSFKTSRQFACYSGIAPFEYSSGSSIRGKSKVSHLANKKMKSLLNMGAINAIRHDMELNAYYKRKLAEGKNAMLVINAIRNKLISRVFAAVNRGTPFVKTMNYAA